jgi:hypothetical protein
MPLCLYLLSAYLLRYMFIEFRLFLKNKIYKFYLAFIVVTIRNKFYGIINSVAEYLAYTERAGGASPSLSLAALESALLNSA